jgi:predicted nucleic acid-binding protein
MSFPADPSRPLIADASVVINLNATLCAAQIIISVPNKLHVTATARVELKGGLRNGHLDAEKLDELIKTGAIRIAELGSDALAIYESLIEGPRESTLDDGEAATIACAHERKGIAIIDERKARSICVARFPDLTIVSSAEILTSDVVANALGREAQITAIVNALRIGRMRVPLEHVEAVICLIGEEHALSCPSLPKSVRRGAVTSTTKIVDKDRHAPLTDHNHKLS